MAAGPQIVDYVKFKGNILNDSDSGVDCLEHSIYAEALAEKIDRVTTPITIGIFARWGSGKSFLLKHVRNLLERRQRQNNVGRKSSRGRSTLGWRCRCCIRIFMFLYFLSIIIISAMWIAHPALFVASLDGKSNVTTTKDINLSTTTTSPAVSTTSAPDYSNHYSRYIALAVLLLSLVVIGVVVCGNNEWWSSEFHKNLRLVLFVAFTKLPIKSAEKSIVKEFYGSDHMMMPAPDADPEVTSNKKFIFVNFNAWEYAGSDTLWAGIITTLSNAIEAEFGSVTARLFRMLKVKAMAREERKEELPKMRKPILYTWLRQPAKASGKRRFIAETMMQYGVVRECKPLDEQGNSPGTDGWWMTCYSNIKEAVRAYEALSLLGIVATFDKPPSKPRSDVTAQNHVEAYPQEYAEVAGAPANETTTFIQATNSLSPRYPGNQLLPSSSSSSSTPPTEPQDDYKPQSCFWHFLKHPKTVCYLPTLFWHILAVFALIALPVITYTLADMLHLDVYRTGRAVPIVVQIVSWLPAVGAAAFVILRFIWAMFHSQRTRINSALAGTKGNMATQLGFMNKVKTEVQYVTKLLKCAEYSHNKQYKVIISIDDLDRCALEKIKSVFEAMSILLSDNSSPFVCLVAVDSRVAVKCIEDTMGAALVKSNVNGYEYLKKIINLPFCLPEIDTKMKKRFITGLIDLADETSKKKVVHPSASIPSAPNPSDANSNNRRSTVDFRPPHMQMRHHDDSLQSASTPPASSIVRSQTRSSFDSHDELEERGSQHSHLLRNPSQLPLLQNADRVEHRPLLWRGDRRQLHRGSTFHNGQFKDEPDGAPSSKPTGKGEVQSDALADDISAMPYIEDKAAGGERKSEPGDSKSSPEETPPEKPAPEESLQNPPDASDQATASTVGCLEDQTHPVAQFTHPEPGASQPPNEIKSVSLESPLEKEATPPQFPPTDPKDEIPLGTTTFLYRCRNFLYNNEMVLRHVEGNPRNIKRIFNVLSLTSWILHCYERDRKKTEFLLGNCVLHQSEVESCKVRNRTSKSLPAMTGTLAEDLVVWVVLIDQWPYRMSYLLEVLEDLEQRPSSEGNSPFDPDSSLLDIFEKCVRPEMERINSKDDDSGLLSMDIHPDMFISFLKEIKGQGLLRTRPSALRRITINLDQSLRQTIVRQREGLLKRSASRISVSSAK